MTLDDLEGCYDKDAGYMRIYMQSHILPKLAYHIFFHI